jgi:hypothetical protein
VAGCCECGDGRSGSCAMELVTFYYKRLHMVMKIESHISHFLLLLIETES